jgi:DNA polymerase-3 subunit alpha
VKKIEYPGSLHNHTQMSNFRLRDCIIKEEDLIDRAIELNHSVLAITDHETIASAVRIEKLYNKVLEKKIPLKIIMGNEIYLCRDNLSLDNYVAGEDKYYHFILLAKDRIGFQQICELSTRAWTRSYMGRGMRRVPTYYRDIVEIIGSNPGHVIGSTACLGGMLATQILKHKATQSYVLWNNILNWCRLMEETFGGKGNFYLELQPSASEEQTYVNKKLIEISNILNIPYIITCDSHYLKEEDRKIHKAYLNSQNGDREVDAFYATTYLMSTKELEEHLDLTREELDTAYKNILTIQNSCEDYSILKPLKIPSLKWKSYNEVITQDWIEKIPYLKTFSESTFDGDRILAQAIIAGIKKHKDLQNQEAYNEINSNLEMTWISSKVNNAHWSAYYLNLQKIIDLCWEAGSLVGPGRGSGVGFILLYVLDITQINPLLEETKTYAWRFLNPERVSVLDVDFDIEGSKRAQVLDKFREFYGQDRVANVTTFRTEKAKSAILTAARGLGIDVDEAQYLASLIPSDRGQQRSLKEVYYGDKEKDFKPVSLFVNAMNGEYSELWEIAQKIEGLICGTGIHAGGIIFVDEPFYNSTALMRAPDGTICTQFDLHNAEDVSLIKYDALSVEAMDKIHICLDLLCEYNYIKREKTLKETYDKVLGVYNIDRTSPEMWEMIWNHKILSLFQMEQQSGIQGINLAKPKSVNDLCVLNSVIRLMAPDKDSDTPLVTWSKYRKNINLWKQEMREYGLSNEEIEWLSLHPAITDGICESQEGLMSLVQEDKLGHNTLTFADKCRKGIAKKQGKLFQECEDIFYENIEKNNCSKKLAHYVWDVLLKVQRGYSFNKSHCLAYSLVALQEMNLAYHFPIIFWNCACLISDSGCLEEDGTTDYGKIATAINKMIEAGISVKPIDINESEAVFAPDVENNSITYGLKALSNVGLPVIDAIKQGRPYKNIKDFMNRCPLNKTAMISLIKGGAFDKIDSSWAKNYNCEVRLATMTYYLSKVSEPKKRLTLQNFSGLVQKEIIPESLDFEKRVFEFNKYLKTVKYKEFYTLNEDYVYNFFAKNFEDFIDELEIVEDNVCIKQNTWDKIYQSVMNNVRNWLKENEKEVLKEYNYLLFNGYWDKYAEGNISKWEMASLCFYCHQHELANVNISQYGISDFNKLPSIPKVDYFFKRSGKEIPIYSTYKIIGTVIGKDDNKASISLLTTTGVVNVKFTKEYYAVYAKQISEKQQDGTKKVVEKGWFTRGSKLMLTGFRRDDTFVTKSYKNTPTHQIYLIQDVSDDGEMTLIHDRYKGENNV